MKCKQETEEVLELKIYSVDKKKCILIPHTFSLTKGEENRSLDKIEKCEIFNTEKPSFNYWNKNKPSSKNIELYTFNHPFPKLRLEQFQPQKPQYDWTARKC